MRSFGVGAGAALLAAWALGSADPGDVEARQSAFRSSQYGRAGAFSFAGEEYLTAYEARKQRLARWRQGETVLGLFGVGAGQEGAVHSTPQR